MGDGKGARDEAEVDESPQADQKPLDPTDDANREPTRPTYPTSPENNPSDKTTPTGVEANAKAKEDEGKDGEQDSSDKAPDE